MACETATAADNTSERRNQLQRRIQEIRTKLLEAVLQSDGTCGSLPFMAELRARYLEINSRISEVASRIDALRSAKLEYIQADSQCASARSALSRATASLDQYAGELGKRAYEASLKGAIAQHPALSARALADQRVAELRRQIQELEAAGGSAWSKMKAKAQQLVVTGKIKLEEFKFRQLEEEAGKQIISSKQESGVRCADTASAVDRICVTRNQIAECQRQLDEHEMILRTKNAASTETFGCRITGIASLEEEMRRCEQVQNSATAELHQFEAGVPATIASQPECEAVPEIKHLLEDLSAAENELRASGGSSSQTPSSEVPASHVSAPPQPVDEKAVLRTLARVILKKDKASTRQYTDEGIEIGPVVDAVKNEVANIARKGNQPKPKWLHEGDWWVAALGNDGGVLLKGSPNDFCLKVYLTNEKEIMVELAEAGLLVGGGGVLGGVGIGLTAGAAAGGVGLAALAAPVLIPVAIGTAIGLVSRKGRLEQEAREVQDFLANHLDDVIESHIRKARRNRPGD